MFESSKLRDLAWFKGGLFGEIGIASGRLDGRRLEGKIDDLVTVALLLAELLETAETTDAGGGFFLEVDGFFECRRRVSLFVGMNVNIC